MSNSRSIPFRIKFCGFRRAEDVRDAIELGADALGLNFCSSSPRFVSLEVASQLAALARGKALIIGVFANSSVEEIRKVLRICPLDFVQLHGDETPELVIGQGLPPIIKATPWREGNLEDSARAKAWTKKAVAARLAGLLVDAYDPIQRGGTGRVVRWELLNPRPIEFDHQNLILAGGLTAMNVAEAVRISCPDAVDTASGIEVEPGIKDRIKMQAFVSQAKKGFESEK